VRVYGVFNVCFMLVCRCRCVGPTVCLMYG